MGRRMFNFGRRLATRSLLKRSQSFAKGKRFYQTPRQFDRSSSLTTRALLDKVDKPFQSPIDSGQCHQNAEKLRKDLQKQISGDKPLRLQLSDSWTEKNAKLVMQGYPAAVGGHGTTGETSRFGKNGDHGVTVIAVHPEDANKPLSKDTRFLVFDGDVTHSKESYDRFKEVGEKGLEWSDGMRIMTHEELSRVQGKESEPDGDGFRNGPMEVVKQASPRTSLLEMLAKLIFE